MYNIKRIEKRGTDEEFEHEIHCPICREEYVHFGNTFGKAGDDLGYEQWRGRGGCVRIPMYCEAGHKWEMALGHHKGKTYVFNTNKGDMPSPEFF